MKSELEPFKGLLRRRLRERLRRMTPGQREEFSRRLCDQITRHPLWQRARRVLGYVPRPDEPDLRALWELAFRQGKTVGLPRYNRDLGHYEAAALEAARSPLSPGRYGIPEPGDSGPLLPLERQDLILAPGLGFDRRGCRLGRGKGYYDRLLTTLRGVKCGIAFDLQVVEGIPTASHDISMDFIVTPTQWYEVSQSADFE